MKLRSRHDANHGEIVRALEKVGFRVISLSRVGGGCPDLLVARHGRTTLVEIKTATGKESKAQERFRADWPGSCVVLRSADEVKGFEFLERDFVFGGRGAHQPTWTSQSTATTKRQN